MRDDLQESGLALVQLAGAPASWSWPLQAAWGSSPGGEKYGARLRVADELAQFVARVPMGEARERDPLEVLLDQIYIAAAEVEYCTERVAELEPHRVVAGEQLNIWIRERREAGQNAARFAKLAIDAGVSERQVRIAEQLGSIIGQLLWDVFAELELTPAQHAKAKTVEPHHLELVADKVLSSNERNNRAP